jgi:hypothetical protein
MRPDHFRHHLQQQTALHLGCLDFIQVVKVPSHQRLISGQSRSAAIQWSTKAESTDAAPWACAPGVPMPCRAVKHQEDLLILARSTVAVPLWRT